MKIFMMLAICLISTECMAVPDTLWSRVFGNSTDEEYAYDVAADKNNNLIVAGNFETQTTDGGLLIKYAPDGDTMWTRKDNSKHFMAVTTDTFGDIFVAGNSYSLTKYSPSGSLLWNKQCPLGTCAYDVVADKDNNIIATGYTTDIMMNFLVVKYNSNGDTLWTRQYPSGSLSRGIAIDNNNNILVTGQYEDTSGGGYEIGCLTVKYNSNGDTCWARRSMSADEGYAVTTDNNGNIFVGKRDGIVIKYTPDGDTMWTKLIGILILNSLAVIEDTNLILAGAAGLGMLAKCDPNGNVLWSTSCNIGTEQCVSGVIIDKNNNIIISGETVSTSRNFLTVKYEAETAVEENSSASGGQISKLTAYPNPFINSTLINYDLPITDCHLQISIYDISGKLVESHSTDSPYSTYSTITIGKNLRPGVYFLKTSDSKQSLKLIKLR